MTNVELMEPRVAAVCVTRHHVTNTWCDVAFCDVSTSLEELWEFEVPLLLDED